MTLQSLAQNLSSNTLDISLPAFRPELIICATIVVMLLMRIVRFTAWIDPFVVALIGSLVAFYYAIPEGGVTAIGEIHRQELFTGMLVYDSMTVFFRMFLLFFAVWFLILVRMTGLADRQDGQDFYALLLGSILGMCLMASANHLMTVFLAVEMASVPSYVMAGIIKGRRRASEASLKYAVYGAGAAGVMLYGISLLAGILGTAQLPAIANKLASLDIPSLIASGKSVGTIMVLVLAGVMIMVGLAFKLSAVPFHFWCPDVFEGASAEVDAFLSVASKAAAMALLVRVAIGVGTIPTAVAPAAPTAIHSISAHTVAYQSSTDGAVATAAVGSSIPGDGGPLAPVRRFIVIMLAIVAGVTCTFGNLAAYGQTNIKRLLAYSTIAHAGYMIMAVAAAVQLAGTDVVAAREAVAALIFYLALYLFMNLGAFAIVAFLRAAIRSEEIADYAGLIRSAPVTAVAFTGILVSLIGIPPMAGFMGKFAIFQSLVVAGGSWMIGLLVLAGLNTAISLVYYLRVAKVVCIDAPPAERGSVYIGFLPVLYVLIVAVPVLIYGIIPSRVLDIARDAAQQLFMQEIPYLPFHVSLSMPSSDTTDILNRVLEILERSFPQYLRWARPYIPPGRENVMQTIDTIVAGQDAVAERVARQVSEAGGLTDHGDFPIEFTDTHDLDIDFLVAEAIDCLKQDVTELAQCVDTLRLAPAAQSLVSEALGLTKGHLELLEKIPLDPAASTVVGPPPALDND